MASNSGSSNKKRLLHGGYLSSLKDDAFRNRYCEKLRAIEGLDSYETEKLRKTGRITLISGLVLLT